MKKMKRGPLLVLGALLALVLTGCSVDAEPNEAGLVYDAGSWSDTTFQDCIKPGSRTYVGPGDRGFAYPQGERSYEFSTAEDADAPPFTALSSDNQEMTISGILSFSLNTDCEVLQKFHERIGIQYGASDEGLKEWDAVLDKYLGQVLQRELTDSSEEFTAAQLYGDPAKTAEWAAAVTGAPDAEESPLEAAVADFAKGPYFRDFTLILQKPIPPQQLLDQFQEQQTQAERENTIAAQARAQAAEIDQIRQLVETFGGWEGYIAYRNQLQCEENPEACVPFLPIPQGSGVNVNPGG